MNNPDLSGADLLGKFVQSNVKDFSFAPDLEHDFPPEYYEMVDVLKRGNRWTGSVSAVRGFHFSPKLLKEIFPQNGELYFFPNRPTVSQSEQIASLSQSASGWNQRREAIIGGSKESKPIFCYAIEPDPKIPRTKTVIVEPNANYFGLMGLKVIAEHPLKWLVKGLKVVP